MPIFVGPTLRRSRELQGLMDNPYPLICALRHSASTESVMASRSLTLCQIRRQPRRDYNRSM